MALPLLVCAGVVCRGGRYLLATRPPGSRLAGRWEFPGGKVVDGESLVDCIRRELCEELGLSVGAVAQLDVVEFPEAEPPLRLHFLTCALEATAEPVAHEGQRVGWFTLTELQSLDLLPADRLFVERLVGRRPQP